MNYLDEKSQIFEMMDAFDYFCNWMLLGIELKNECTELEYGILKIKALAKELDAED